MILRKRWQGSIPRRRPRPTNVDSAGNPPPPAVQQAQALARWHLSKPADTQHPTPAQELYNRLYSLPSVSHMGKASEIRLRDKKELSEELGPWRRACAAAYAALTGPLSYHHRHFRNKVSRVVAHTIRLLMILGHHQAAKDLDRAFFTSHPRPPPTSDLSSDGPPSADGLLIWGRGMNIDRGQIQLAWLYSFALRLVPGLYEDPDEFRNLLDKMRDAHAETGFTPLMVSYLVNNAEAMVLNMMGEDVRKTKNEEELEELVDAFLVGVRGMDTFAGSDKVRMALLDVEMEKLELKGREANEEHLRRVEREIQDLLAKFDITSQPDDSLETPSPPSLTSRQLGHKAHVLHSAIRLLLFRARLATDATTSPHRRHSSTSLAVTASLRLYDQLLSLLSDTVHMRHLPDIQARQTSSFYRTLWACVGILHPTHARESRHDHPRNMERTPPPDPPSIELCLSSIETTLAALSALPDSSAINSPLPSPRALRISDRFWQRLLLVLCVPACPSRRIQAGPPAERPPWTVLRRALSLIIDCKSHDLTISSTPLTTSAARSRKVLFRQTAVIIHVVRATLMGGTDRNGAEEGSVEDRLEYLFWFFDRLEGLDESLNRNTVRSAAEEVLAREWPGIAWSAWRKEMRARVVQWSEKKDVRVEAKEEVKSTVAQVSSTKINSLPSSVPSTTLTNDPPSLPTDNPSPPSTSAPSPPPLPPPRPLSSFPERKRLPIPNLWTYSPSFSLLAPPSPSPSLSYLHSSVEQKLDRLDTMSLRRRSGGRQ